MAFSSPVLRVLWLPLVLLLVFVILGVVWALWRLAAVERRVSNFPEIDWAWEEATLGLRKPAVESRPYPVDLRSGRARERYRVFVSGLTNVVLGLGPSQAAEFADQSLRDSRGDLRGLPGGVGAGSACGRGGSSLSCPSRGRGYGRGGPESRTADFRGAYGFPGALTSGSSDGLFPDDHHERGSRSARFSPGPDRPPGKVLGRKEELDRIAAGLSHLCGLIVRDRQPFCPANGILALIPYTATDDKSQARRAGTACHLDVTTARSSAGVSCPLFTLLCNMEEAKCFERLIRAYVSKPHYSLLGGSFPLAPIWTSKSECR